jgi:hypothetical protein
VGCVVRASGPTVLVDYSARVFCTLLFTDFHSSKNKKNKKCNTNPIKFELNDQTTCVGIIYLLASFKSDEIIFFPVGNNLCIFDGMDYQSILVANQLHN